MDQVKQAFDWKTPAREWDIRVNLDGDLDKETEYFLYLCKQYTENVQCKFFLVGGVEKGLNPKHSSFKRYHVHVCLITKDRVYPVALKNKLSLSKLSDGTKRSYYLNIRPINFPYKGWIDHHTKCATKIYCSCDASILSCTSEEERKEHRMGKHTLFRFGDPPNDKRKSPEVDAEEGISLLMSKKAKSEERFQEMFDLFMAGDYDHAQMVRTYGKAWLQNYKDFVKMFGGRPCPDPPLGHFPDGKNLVIWGPPGTGKSLYVKWKYPNCFYRSAVNYKYWDGFRPEEHSHIYYEDMDRAMFNSRDIGPGQWKIWLDPEGIYDGEIKFQAPLAKIRHPVIVTSNYHPSEWLLPGYGSEKDKEAILRRLRVVHIDELLRAEGVRLKRGMPPKSDPAECFESYNYEKQSLKYILN